MKVTPTVFLALMASSGVISGPLQKRAEVTVTTVQTFFTTITVDGPEEATADASTTQEAPVVTPSSEPAPSDTDIESPSGGADNPEPETTSTSTTPVASPTEDATPEPETSQESTSESGTASTDGPASSDPFLAASLEHHNVHRANHSSPAMTWGDDIASYAAITAATCKFAHDTETGGGGYGQNIAMWASSGDVRKTGETVFIGRTISEMWYNGEINLFPSQDYGADSPDMADFHAWGHYTQVIWAETTTVGCAVQYCEPGVMVEGMHAFYSVCNYFPPGNMGGGYGENVLPPQGNPTFHAS